MWKIYACASYPTSVDPNLNLTCCQSVSIFVVFCVFFLRQWFSWQLNMYQVSRQADDVRPHPPMVECRVSVCPSNDYPNKEIRRRPVVYCDITAHTHTHARSHTCTTIVCIHVASPPSLHWVTGTWVNCTFVLFGSEPLQEDGPSLLPQSSDSYSVVRKEGKVEAQTKRHQGRFSQKPGRIHLDKYSRWCSFGRISTCVCVFGLNLHVGVCFYLQMFLAYYFLPSFLPHFFRLPVDLWFTQIFGWEKI